MSYIICKSCHEKGLDDCDNCTYSIPCRDCPAFDDEHEICTHKGKCLKENKKK